ncbi:MAG TPA: hypothetical protein ENF25_02380 [Thermoprotei archaeon]|nr:hypothetical protein [Thermoprotei archaeon]
MIRIVGTVHVMPVKDEIRRIMTSSEGWHVAIELDPERLRAILDRRHMETSSVRSSSPLLLRVLYNIERRVGRSFHQDVGADMLSAYELARELHLNISLIDIPIHVTLRRLMSAPVTERLKLLIEGILMLLLPSGKKVQLEEFLSIKHIENLIETFKRRYPSIYEMLVVERDRYLFKRIIDLENKFGNVIAFIGALHAINLRKMFEDQGRDVSDVEQHRTFLTYIVR